MKTAKRFWIGLVGIVCGVAVAPATLAQVGYDQPGYGQPDYDQPYYDQPYGQPGDYSPDFYDNLSPYGEWVQTPEYGNVWIPNVEPGFQPYASNGHWVVTEYGNTWVSDYAWGWAPFHYGRWYLDRYNRWAWVPGYEWGPAWVNWRSGGGYYGWAPLGPIQAGPGFNINVNINIPPAWWTFVPQAYITSPRLYSYCVPRPRVVNIYHNTTIINNVHRVNNRTYVYGPRREEIEYVTRRSVPVYRLENSGRPGRTVIRDNSVGLYRPDINRGSRSYGNNAPSDRRVYQRRDNPSTSGTYGGDFQNRPTDGNQRYGQQRERERSQPQATPWGQERNSRYEQQRQSRQSAPQAEQSYTQPDRSGSSAQGPQNRWERRQEATPQRENGQSGSTRVQEQRSGGFNNRSEGQSPAPQGGSPERRSRGPR